MSQYDKLGELLKDAIAKGDFYKESQTAKKSDFQEANIKKENTPVSEESESNFSENFTKNIWKDTDSPYLMVLGISSLNCSLEDVKNAYRKLLKKYHPDNVPPFPEMQKTAAKRTQEIVEAYKKLGYVRE